MIDAHNHLDFDAFDADRAARIDEARAHGIVGSVLAATHPQTWARTRSIAAATDSVAVLGVHPGWTDRIADWDDLVATLRAEDPTGVGEIGLDRRLARAPQAFAWQLDGLRAQLALARELDRPVVFHCVGAYPELLSTLRRDGLPRAGGMIHGWSGPPDRVDEAVQLGLALSFGLAVTRPNAPRQVESVRAVPLDRLLIETDCPDQVPWGLDRDRGIPADLRGVADAVARARGLAFTEVAEATHRNAAHLFGLGSPP